MKTIKVILILFTLVLTSCATTSVNDHGLYGRTKMHYPHIIQNGSTNQTTGLYK